MSKALYVLFDQECALCQRCRQWLMRQEAFIELRFIPLQSPEVARRFPGLREWPDLDLREKLVVISDEGPVYQGQNAWIMCLYALKHYREGPAPCASRAATLRAPRLPNHFPEPAPDFELPENAH